ncbi:MAG: MFS transporter [Planctomycetes bacterium]|nr:MFS transporter [Planctomycetota bacterium]
MSTPADANTSAAVSPKVSATLALTLLVLINLFNYIDRQVLAAVEPEIRKELLPDDSGAEPKDGANQEESEDAKFWMGWLATAFLLSYMLIAPLFGILADRISRWWLVGFGVLLWSLASGGSGVDWGVSIAAAYWVLLITRCFVGVGEAAYGPVAPAMIADLYPIEKRGKVMAWFYLAIPVGGALGYALGEVIEKAIGWRWAFYAVVPPGIALGIWCFFMPDPPRGQAESSDATANRKPSMKDYLFLLTIPSYTLNTLGMAMRLASASLRGVVLSGFRIRVDSRLPNGLGRALDPLPVDVDIHLPGRLPAVLQHRSDEHDSRQRDASVHARQRVRLEHLDHSHAGRCHLAAAHRLDRRQGAPRPRFHRRVVGDAFGRRPLADRGAVPAIRYGPGPDARAIGRRDDTGLIR